MATSNDKSIESLDNPTKLETLKRLRENVDWEIEGERRELLNQLHPLVKDWTDQLPNLREIFCREEIEWLLSAVISDNYKGEDKRRFVEFVSRTGYKDEPDVDEDGNISPRRTTLVHKAARNKQNHYLVDELFRIYNRFDVNYVDELGITHFHIACRNSGSRAIYRGEVEKFLEFGQDPNCHPPPLHEAINGYNTTAIRLLLKHGADPNLADAEGLTPLHKICMHLTDDIIPVSMLFMISDEKHQLVKVDPLDKFGRTPLHYALMSKWNKKKMLQVLIKIKDANPNIADVDGLTPLHLICQRNSKEEDLVELFFEMCDAKHHLVPVDPLDNRGRTPLYYAVANLLPNNVDFLLNRGADLSKFVFPTESDFDEIFKKLCYCYYASKLKLVPGAMGVVENLEKRGYELDQGDVLMIMKWYAKYGLFENSEELDKYLYKDEEFVSKAKNQMIRTGVLPYNKCVDDDDYYDDDDDYDDDDEMEDEDRAEKVVKKAEESFEGPSLSLYDLIQLRPEEIEKLFTYWDYEHLRHTCSRWGLTDRVIQACVVHLCEMRSRRFFRRWAVYPFWDLIHQRLPLEVCEMVVEHLTNEDLYHICLAAMDPSHKTNENNVITNVIKCNNKRQKTHEG